MFNVVLYQPEIPPNTGNIIRLCANTGSSLHLISPLGFDLDDRKLRRAGLDYREWARVNVYADLTEFSETMAAGRMFAFTTRGLRNHTMIEYQPDDILLFGPETRGLPLSVLRQLPRDHWLRIPMQRENRSMNLSNAVAVAVYEAWRQQGFREG